MFLRVNFQQSEKDQVNRYIGLSFAIFFAAG